MKRIFFHRKPIMKQRKSEKVEEKVKIKNGRKTEKDTKKAEKNYKKQKETREITPADQTRTPACLVLLYGLAHFGFLPHILGKVLEPSLNLFFVFFFHFFLLLYFYIFLFSRFCFYFPFSLFSNWKFILKNHNHVLSSLKQFKIMNNLQIFEHFLKFMTIL